MPQIGLLDQVIPLPLTSNLIHTTLGSSVRQSSRLFLHSDFILKFHLTQKPANSDL